MKIQTPKITLDLLEEIFPGDTNVVHYRIKKLQPSGCYGYVRLAIINNKYVSFITDNAQTASGWLMKEVKTYEEEEIASDENLYYHLGLIYDAVVNRRFIGRSISLNIHIEKPLEEMFHRITFMRHN